MKMRDRIKELRRVKASDLRPNPRNWRVHPRGQQDALRGVLAEIGYADALLARELTDGSLELIDGHLRAETTPETDVPVLVLDLDEQEADKLLVLLDPLSAMAGQDADLLKELLERVETENESIQAVLDGLGRDAGAAQSAAVSETVDVKIDEMFQIVVDCRDEPAQRTLFERLSGEGFKCRALVI